MIISKTPFRISIFGGGSDFPQWYRENGGAVLSTAIDKYCYIQTRYLPPFFDYSYRIRYSFREEVNSINDIKHPSVRECIKFMKINKGLEMVHTGDIPAMSGIGSSSSFSVGFLNTLYALKGEMVSKRQLALDAVNIEQNIIKEAVGSQDQVVAAYGGFNRIEFGANDGFKVYPITIGRKKLDDLQNRLMLFFTGFQRNSSEIAQEQIREIPKNKKQLGRMVEMVDEGIDILNGSNLDDFGKLLHESWMIKRSLSSKITNPEIDNIYKKGLEAGALGGKLLGAGSGGCMIFIVRSEDQDKVREKLKNLVEIPFKFENEGSRIVYMSDV